MYIEITYMGAALVQVWLWMMIFFVFMLPFLLLITNVAKWIHGIFKLVTHGKAH